MSGTQLGREPSGVPATDLSNLFAATTTTAAVPDRTQGVPRLAPTSSRPAEPPAAPKPTSALPPASPPPAVTPAKSPRPRRATRRPPASVVVYLSISLRARLRAHAETGGRSHTQIVFDALNATHTRLAELAAASAAHHPDVQPGDGLFVAQRSARRVHDEDQVQVSIRPNPTNLDVIDQLADRHTSGNRTALIALALDEYLPPLQQGTPE